MATARVPTITWVARQGEVYLARPSAVMFSGTSSSDISLSGHFAGVASGIMISAAVKNITVTPPETSWEKQDFMGETSNFQNQLLDEKPVGLATCTGTLVLGEDETIEDYMTSGTITGASGFTRYQIGKERDTEDSRVTAAVVLTTKDNANCITFAFDKARITKYGDVRISGPDSHWEQDFTLVCLTKDFIYEIKD